jgi:uncharacterized protein (TIGR03437 family)
MVLGRFLWVLLVLRIASAQTGIISTIAGTTTINGAPARGWNGDNRPAITAPLALANFTNQCDPNRFEQTSHISVDAAGNIYFADSNNQRIRRIDPSGAIATIVGSGDPPQTDSRCQPLGSIADGPATAARLFNPSDVLLHPNGNLIIADQQNNRIRQVSPAGVVSTIAGNGLHNLYAPGVIATASPMDWPSSLAVDSAGTLYFAELHSNRVGKIVNGALSTAAGTGFPGYNGDGISATTATLSKPAGIAIDRTGALLIADTGNHRVRRVSGGTITTIAGNGKPGFCGDGGRAADACLDTPMDVKADAIGNLYIADAGNHRVRRIDSAGNITTVAGTGDPGRGADAVAATTSALNFPSAVAVDANNDLYIVDWQNYLIRKVSFGTAPALATGGVVNAASFTAPVAPGSIISLFGVNFDVKETRVEVTGNAIPLSLVSAGQINAQLPYETPAGTATAAVITPSGRSAAVPFTVAPAAVAMFAYSDGTRAIAVNADGTLNAPDTPIARGGVVVFYVTGLGAVSPAVATGQPAPSDVLSYAAAAVSVTIGGASATTQFAGLTPGFIGLGQINVLVPTDVPTGDAVPVIIQAGGQSSKTATITIR